MLYSDERGVSRHYEMTLSAVPRVEVEDWRSEKVLGIRFHESKPLKADVTAASDPAVWVRDGMQTYLDSGRTQTPH
jgi:hypothetical protein